MAIAMEEIAAGEPTVEEAPKKQDPRRDYVVLMAVGDKTWELVGRATGTRKDALDEVVDGLPEEQRGNEFVPVPARSWKPGSRKTTVKSTWS